MATEKKKEILYVIAYDKNRVLVKAKDAEKGKDYFCPGCGDELTLKKSGKTGKGSKRPHFAHRPGSPNCTPEGVLHKTFKLLLLEKIKKHIAEKIPIIIEWECVFCHEKHKGDLIKWAIDAKDEYPMEKCRADIALIGQEGKLFSVIELVVTHKPEEAAIAYYKENKIALIQILLESDDDLEKIDEKINFPTSVDYCINPQCPNHGEYFYIRKPKIIEKKCGNFHIMTSCIAVTNHYFGFQQSTDFSDEDIKFAKSKGVVFEGKSIICPYCRAERNRYGRRSPRL